MARLSTQGETAAAAGETKISGDWITDWIVKITKASRSDEKNSQLFELPSDS
jgi:hypothetical protein